MDTLFQIANIEKHDFYINKLKWINNQIVILGCINDYNGRFTSGQPFYAVYDKNGSLIKYKKFNNKGFCSDIIQLNNGKHMAAICYSNKINKNLDVLLLRLNETYEIDN